MQTWIENSVLNSIINIEVAIWKPGIPKNLNVLGVYNPLGNHWYKPIPLFCKQPPL